jgi:hypothetical protein
MSRSLKKVHIDIKDQSVKVLAEWGSVRDELRIAKKICESINRFSEDRDDEATIIDALFTAALIRYIRCFHPTGKRVSLSLDDVPIDLQEAHQYFKNIRDKHVTHSVNSYEKAYVEAYIEIENGERKPIDRLLTGSERVVFNKRQADFLNLILRDLLDAVTKKMEAAQQDALKVVNILDEEIIMRFDKYVPMTLDTSKVAKPRS